MSISIALAVLSCASRSYAPDPIESTEIISRAQVKEEDGIRVRASVPSPEESRAIFGLPVYDRGIQPIWLEITNQREERVRFAPVGTDREYFSPHEVAYMHKRRYGGDAYDAMERRIAASAMPRWIWPGETRSGFVFTHVEPGTKAFNVDVLTVEANDATFGFFVQVPGFEPDHAAIDFQRLYADDEITRVDANGLRDALTSIGCCTTDATGEGQGLPLNVVLVGPGLEVLQALLRAGFIERPRSERETDLVTAPFWKGRRADAVFRTTRQGRGERNELRVWRAPIEVDGAPVWMGQLTHFIGQPTPLGRAFFDPRLDPDLDEATAYVMQRMWYAQALTRYAWHDTGEAHDIDAPARDFRGVEFFTAGTRVVLWLSGEPVSQDETEILLWDSAPFEEGS